MRNRTWFLAVGVGLPLGVGVAGCMQGSAATDLTQMLDSLAAQAANVPALNQLTVSDVVSGFSQFVSRVLTGSAENATPLSDRQSAQIAQLHSQSARGQITPDQLADGVDQAVSGGGDAEQVERGRRFGGPFHPSAATDPMNLTSDQRTQADDLFRQARADVEVLRQTANADILAVLTPDQAAALDQLAPQFEGGAGASGGESPAPTTQPVLPWIYYLSDALGLTGDQWNKIDQIRTDLRTAVMERHQQARDAFRALLTPDQQKIFDQPPSPPSPPSPRWPRHGHGRGHGGR